MTRLAFLSMDSLEGFVCYDSLVSDILENRGLPVDVVSWRDATADWNRYDMVIQRSPWDYQQAPDAYLETLARIDRSQARLQNSLAISRWNIRKTYLQQLERSGIAIVPTRWMDSPAVHDLKALPDEFGVAEVVVKPVIGANADHAFRLSADSPDELWEAAAATYRNWTALAQPFVTDIQATGEVSLIFFGGQFSHAVVKQPKPGDFRVQEEHGGRIASMTPEADLVRFAARCLEVTPEPALYARVDLVFPGSGRQPAVMEVELLEPSLYLTFDSEAPDRFARAIIDALG